MLDGVDSTSFEAFGTPHLVMLGIAVAGPVPVALLGRRLRDDGGRAAGRIFCLVLVGFLLPLQILDHTPSRFELHTSLPVQLCDLAAIAAAVGLWTQRRIPVALTYFWGILLTPQALLTPALASGFPTPTFFTFFGMHILIVWAAVFLVFGLGLSPTWRDLRASITITALWMVAVFGLNLMLGTNYGFVNRKPTTASILDYLGPWPLYLVVEIVLVAGLWALMTWPWERRRRP